MMVWLWILIGLNISELKGYSNGDFPQACDSMLPVHDYSGGVFPPQSSEPPFEISYELGRRTEDPITVILKSKDSRRFRGFMLEARNRNLGGDGPPIGKFITLNSQMTRLLKCNNLPDSAVSQRFNGHKSEFRVNWTVQGEDLDIIFRATFLQEYEIFWERVTVILARPTSTSVPSTTEPTTVATTTESTEPTTITESTEPTTTTESTEPTTTTESTEPTTTAESTEPTTTTESTEPTTTTESTEPTTITESTEPTTTTESTEPTTTTESTEPTTTAESTEPTTTTESTEPTTITESTEPTTTTESTDPTTTTESTEPTTIIESTEPTTTTESTDPTTTTESTEPTTTTESTEPTTTTESTEPTTITESTEPTTTTESTEPTTTTESTEPTTTTESTEPTTTTESTEPTTTTESTESTEPNNTTSPSNKFRYSKTLSTFLILLDSNLEHMKMEISNNILVLFASRPIYYKQSKVLMIVCGTLCFVSSVWSLFCFIIDDSFNVTYLYVALVSVVTMINFLEWMFAILPLGYNHDLTDVFDVVLRVCFVVHHILTTVLIFFGVISLTDESERTRRKSWPLIVLVAYTAWILLVIVWNVALTAYRTILKSNRTGNSQGVQANEPQRTEKDAVQLLTVVSVILLVGTTAFSVAVSAGLFIIQKNQT